MLNYLSNIPLGVAINLVTPGDGILFRPGGTNPQQTSFVNNIIFSLNHSVLIGFYI